MKKKILCISTMAFVALSASSSFSCTSILVDKSATKDGGFIAARNDDSDVFSMPRFIKHPANSYIKKVFTSYDNGFTYKMPKNTLQYTSISNFNVKNPKVYQKGEAGFNSAGVGISATETIFGSPNALKVDPYTKTGITEVAITDVILSKVHSAREGVKLLGKIVETQGSGEGFGVAFVDKKELWYFENGSAHQWLAVRVPLNKYFVSGNQGRLKDYNPKDSANYLASKNLVSFAVENGLIKAGEKFDFSKAYIKDDINDTTYNYPRVWALQHLFNPSLTTKIEDSRTTDVFLKPENKISVSDVEDALRNRYQGTKHDPYVNENHKEVFRPVAVFRVEESHILEVRPSLPSDIGEVNYVAIGMQLLSVYIPYYKGMTSYLEGYGTATNKPDDISVAWKYRKLQSLTMLNYNKYAPTVIKSYKDLEVAIAKEQKVMEKSYLSVYKNNPSKAKEIIQSYENKWMQEGLDLTAKLTKQIELDMKLDNPTNDYFEQITLDIYNKYGFHGA